MKMKFGKYKGMDMSSLPITYLRWIVDNFEPNEIRDEAKRILDSGEIQQELSQKSLEEQANELLGEKPIDLLRRGNRRPKYRRGK